MKINPGAVLTTPEIGAIESDETHLYWTDSSGTRRQLDAVSGGGGSQTPWVSDINAAGYNLVGVGGLQAPGGVGWVKIGMYGATFELVDNNRTHLHFNYLSSLFWTNTIASWGPADMGLSRNTTGVLEINNGTQGQYGDLQVRKLNPDGSSLGVGGHINSTYTLGTNIVTNGTFTSDITGWSGTNWAYSALNGGQALHTAGTTDALTEAAITVIAGQSYILGYTIQSRTAGQITASVGGISDSVRMTNSAFTKYFTALTTTALALTPDTDFDGAIDAVTLQPVGPAISCGTAPALVQGSNVYIGTVIAGSGATTCVITFSTPYVNRPSCKVDITDGTVITNKVVTNTSITITAADLSGKTIDYGPCTGLNE
jgi:hypothetical protein